MNYPYSSAFILTDDIFTQNGGDTTEGLEGQRNAAFFIAEKMASVHMRTYLQPTVVTGSYMWPQMGQRVRLDHNRINSILSVTAVSPSGGCSCETREDVGCSYMLDAEHGLIAIQVSRSSGQVYCGCGSFVPYQARIVYNAGIPSGTAYQPDVLLALSTVADIVLNEISGYPANEAPGDHGLIRWANQGYMEERMGLIRTVFGSSPRANFAARILDQAVPGKRALRL